MGKGRGLARAERLTEMKRLYVQRAFSDAEMAERLGVDRTTAYRDRIALEQDYPFVEDPPGRYRIDRNRLLSEIRLNPHEALFLYLPARRLLRQTRFANRHVVNAVEKLAACLQQPMTEKLLRLSHEVLHQQHYPERIGVLERITMAWIDQKKVRITYRALRAKRPLIHTICPYLIEPALWSDSVYVIAYSDVARDIVPFKLERIEDVVTTLEYFDFPDNFDEQQLLRHTWGIWIGDSEPVTVKLRFLSGEATRRVQETVWHPSQQITLLPDGGCEWQAQVADWREILPWVRGWGASVEVIEPHDLRETLMGEAKALAERYGWYVSSQPAVTASTTLQDFFGE
ncbi:helix-turn-helix transcriptional regulator [Chloroflexus aggregans]|uniref:Regulatory protein, DeoR n=1 Tax=Chloroflexus aggregans (strain MD-66 / DSM 9485) TaxID=326427 RepID=B8G7R7_CHLAD|nr:WYL domain-containing protein [Chloroflexus aggregans]ACL24096.1 regulatory protein, DeoR [Chloroflexus aggregans DSM 9485]